MANEGAKGGKKKKVCGGCQIWRVGDEHGNGEIRTGEPPQNVFPPPTSNPYNIDKNHDHDIQRQCDTRTPGSGRGVREGVSRPGIQGKRSEGGMTDKEQKALENNLWHSLVVPLNGEHLAANKYGQPYNRREIHEKI